jgi:hypothetical protein
MAVGDVIIMPTPKRPEPANHIDQMDAVARAKLQISEIVCHMPPEEALGILADMAFRVIWKTFDGEDAVGAARIFCDEVVHAVEQANHRSRYAQVRR